MESGASFKRFDLHLHAPGEGQYFTMPSGESMPETEEEKQAFARRYVGQARKADLALIAITNHNDTRWIDPLRRAANELYSDELVVLPGLEVAADGGIGSIHVLAIFPEATQVDILERFLDDDLGLTRDKRFTRHGQPHPTKRSFADVVDAIVNRGGLAIAAHVFSTDGLLDSRSNEGLTRKAQFCHNRLLGVHINKGRIDDLNEWQRWVVTNRHQDPDFRRKYPIACLNCSDARKLEDIGICFTYVKCERPGFLALKQALLDHQARLRLMDDPPKMPPYLLKRLEVTHTPSGFLRGLELTFNPRLNCIIGGRGTGKSAIVELLRFLWEQEPLRPTEMRGFVDVFFPETAEATLEVVKKQTSYRLIRRHRAPSTIIERCEPGGTWISVPDLHPSDLFPLDIYGQKEVLYTSEDVRSQLDLLDRLVGDELEQLKQEREQLLIDLRRNRESIVSLHDRIDRLEHRLESKPRIEEHLRQYHQSGLEELARTKRLYDRETQAWELALGQVDEIRRALEKAQAEVRIDLSYLHDDELASLPNQESLQALRGRLEALVQIVTAGLDKAKPHITQAQTNIAAARVQWREQQSRFTKKYEQALYQLPGLTPDTVTRLERERMELDLVEREVGQLRQQIKERLDQRQRLLVSILENNRKQYDARKDKAQEISDKLPRVKLQVEQGGDLDWLIEQLRHFLRGSRLREEDYQAMATAAYPHTLSFLAVIEAADPETPSDLAVYDKWLPQTSSSLLPPDPLQHLAAFSNLRDSTKAAKLVEHIPLARRLEMDEMQPPDRVTIKLNIAREVGQENWRPLGQRLGEGVSVGQGCTAILSIILLESRHPLIIDQPEDDLDNRFIYDEIVQTLRRERDRRQMLFATHNANIPVAGDAELIIVLDAQEETRDAQAALHCEVAASGFIDKDDLDYDSAEMKKMRWHISQVLEGGRQAFELRQQKYGF